MCSHGGLFSGFAMCMHGLLSAHEPRLGEFIKLDASSGRRIWHALRSYIGSMQSVSVGYPKPSVATAATVTNTFVEDVSLGFSEVSNPRVLSHHDALLAAMTWRASGGRAFDATFTRGDALKVVVSQLSQTHSAREGARTHAKWCGTAS